MNILIWSAVIITADQLTKQAVRTSMHLHQSIPVIDSYFHFTFVENSGIAFGINFAGGKIFFAITASLASILILYYLWNVRNESFFLRLSLGLILGGAFGNLIDRFMYGRVTDFLDFSLGIYHWPVFNIADSAVTVGMFMYLYYTLSKSKIKIQDE